MAAKTQVAASVWGTFDLHSSRSWMLFGTTRLIDLFVCVGCSLLLCKNAGNIGLEKTTQGQIMILVEKAHMYMTKNGNEIISQICIAGAKAFQVFPN